MQKRIIAVATQLIKKYGLRGFTMDDIAAELGISKKTVYKYFASKNQLISEIVDAVVEVEKHSFAEEIEKRLTWHDKLDLMLSSFSQEDFSYRLVDELLRYYPEEKEKVESIALFRRQTIVPLLEQGIKEGDIRPDFSPEIILLILHKLFLTPTDAEFLAENDLTIRQVLNLMKKLFFQGILVKPDLLK